MAVEISSVEHEVNPSSMPNDSRNEDVVPNDIQSDTHHLATNSSAVRSSPSTELSPAISVTPDSTPAKPDIHNLAEGIKETSAGLFEIESMDLLKQKKTNDQLSAAVLPEDDDIYEEEVIDDSEADEIVEEYEEEVVEDDYSEETIEDDLPLQDDLVLDNPVETLGDVSTEKEIAAEQDSKKDLASIEPSTSNSTDNITRMDLPLDHEIKSETEDIAEATPASKVEAVNGDAAEVQPEPEINTDTETTMEVGSSPTLTPEPQLATLVSSETNPADSAIEGSVGDAVLVDSTTSNPEAGAEAEPVPESDHENQLKVETATSSDPQNYDAGHEQESHSDTQLESDSAPITEFPRQPETQFDETDPINDVAPALPEASTILDASITSESKLEAASIFEAAVDGEAEPVTKEAPNSETPSAEAESVTALDGEAEPVMQEAPMAETQSAEAESMTALDVEAELVMQEAPISETQSAEAESVTALDGEAEPVMQEAPISETQSAEAELELDTEIKLEMEPAPISEPQSAEAEPDPDTDTDAGSAPYTETQSVIKEAPISEPQNAEDKSEAEADGEAETVMQEAPISEPLSAEAESETAADDEAPFSEPLSAEAESETAADDAEPISEPLSAEAESETDADDEAPISEPLSAEAESKTAADDAEPISEPLSAEAESETDADDEAELATEMQLVMDPAPISEPESAEAELEPDTNAESKRYTETQSDMIEPPILEPQSAEPEPDTDAEQEQEPEPGTETQSVLNEAPISAPQCAEAEREPFSNTDADTQSAMKETPISEPQSADAEPEPVTGDEPELGTEMQSIMEAAPITKPQTSEAELEQDPELGTETQLEMESAPELEPQDTEAEKDPELGTETQLEMESAPGLEPQDTEAERKHEPFETQVEKESAPMMLESLCAEAQGEAEPVIEAETQTELNLAPMSESSLQLKTLIDDEVDPIDDVVPALAEDSTSVDSTTTAASNQEDANIADTEAEPESEPETEARLGSEAALMSKARLQPETPIEAEVDPTDDAIQASAESTKLIDSVEAFVQTDISDELPLHNNKSDAGIPLDSLNNEVLSSGAHDEDVDFDAECETSTPEVVEKSMMGSLDGSEIVAAGPLPINAGDAQTSSVVFSDTTAISGSGFDDVGFESKQESPHNIVDSNMETLYTSDVEHADHYENHESAENKMMEYERDLVAIAVLAEQPVAETENEETVKNQEIEIIFGSDGDHGYQQESEPNNVNFESEENDAISCESNHITTGVLTEQSLAGLDEHETFIKPEKKEISFYNPDVQRDDIEQGLLQDDDEESKGSRLQERTVPETYYFEEQESDKNRCDRAAVFALLCAICLLLVTLAVTIPMLLMNDDESTDRDISFPTIAPDKVDPTPAPQPRYELAFGPFDDNPKTGMGKSVSFDNGLLLVGLPSEGQGIVRSFQINQSGKMLSVGDILGEQEGSGFGWAVDIADTVAAVGSPFLFITDTPTEAGGVYVYEYSGSTWSQVGETLRGDEDLFAANEAFGSAVSLSVTDSVYRVVVGAPISNLNDFEIGRVYTFEKSVEEGSAWASIDSTALLGERAGDRFGSSVAISKDGTTFVAGGPGGDLHDDPGLVFVYKYTGDFTEAWEMVFSIAGSEENERFGASVAMLSDNGDIFAIGAPDYGGGSGRVLVYRRDGEGFYQQLGADIVGDRGERIGEANVLSGSASGDSVQVVVGTVKGRVLRYDYSEESQSWSMKFDELVPDFSAVTSISVSGMNAASIAIGSEVDGVVSIYEISGGGDVVDPNPDSVPSATTPVSSPTFSPVFVSPPTSTGTKAPVPETPAPTFATLLEWSVVGGPFTTDSLQSGYGSSVAMSDTQVAVGAPFAGLVKMYGVDTNGSWSESLELTGSDSSDGFGYSLDIDGQGMLVGAPLDGGEGAAYYYENGSGQWMQVGDPIQNIAGPDGFFGSSVAISASRVGVVGAVGFSGDGLTGRGAAYIFELSDGWSMATSQLGAEAGDSLGHAVDIDSSGTMVLLGAPGNKGGYAIVLEKQGSTWDTTLLIQGENDGDGFGTSVKVLSPYHVAVGAPGYMQGRGRVVVYQRVRGTFEEMVDVIGEEGDELGSTLKLAGSGTTLLVGRADGFVKRLDFDGTNSKWIQTSEVVDSGFGSGLQALATPSDDPGKFAASGAEKSMIYALS